MPNHSPLWWPMGVPVTCFALPDSGNEGGIRQAAALRYRSWKVRQVPRSRVFDRFSGLLDPESCEHCPAPTKRLIFVAGLCKGALAARSIYCTCLLDAACHRRGGRLQQLLSPRPAGRWHVSACSPLTSSPSQQGILSLEKVSYLVAVPCASAEVDRLCNFPFACVTRLLPILWTVFGMKETI